MNQHLLVPGQGDEETVGDGGLSGTGRADKQHGHLVAQVCLQEEGLTSRLAGLNDQICHLGNKKKKYTMYLLN